LAILRELGDQRGIARSLINLGLVDFDQGDYQAARARFEEGLAIRRALGGAQGIAAALHNLGAVANACGDHQAAWVLFEEGLATYRELGDRWGIAMSLSNLASIAVGRAEHRVAWALNEEGLSIRRELGDRRGIAESLEGLACVMLALGRPERTVRIWGATDRMREELGAPLSPMDRAGHELQVLAARAAMSDDAAYDLARLEGRAMTLEQAIDYALVKHDG
jgi:tetratricopeptide (TPR) repeat protein